MEPDRFRPERTLGFEDRLDIMMRIYVGNLPFSVRDDELREMFGRRLVLPRRRWAELDDLLDVTEVDGRLYVGGEVRELVTVWWRAPGSRFRGRSEGRNLRI